MARILFALPRFHTNLWFAVRAMLAAGHELQILANGSGSGEDHSLLTPRVMGRHPAQSDVDAAVDAFQPDLVVVRNAWALSRRAARAARTRNIPALLYNLLPMNAPTSILRRAELAWKGLPRQRITPVPGLPGASGRSDPFGHYLPWPVAALPTPAPLAKPGPGAKLHIVCIGKLGLPRKNQPELIDAMEAAGLDAHYHVTLVGSPAKSDDPKQAEHAARIEALSKHDWITLRSGITFADMANVYASADVCVLPSFAEPLGVSPVEAMAYGAIPVISSDSGSAGYLRQGENGFIIDMHQPKTVADALRRIAEAPALRQSLSAAARHKTQTDLSESRFLERLDTILAAHIRR
ncbi:glycosyltransferase family 4 protein [Primorskyibacter sp. 2E107]|uniref:glycosyltransferase family 4 protein n=1 Tax=Primorskyibacter sp. 2E107 TaxID=3403458 RepID=UPI003AF7AE16